MDTDILKKLFSEYTGKEVTEMIALPPSGSHRRYFRLRNDTFTAIGAYHNDLAENRAFLEFTRHFLRKGLHVPELYATDQEGYYYLLSDLGDTMLKSLIDERSTDFQFPESATPYYKKALKELVRFQVEGNTGLDYSVCVPRESFDRQSVLWDLNHFKYFFLKVTGIPFDEQKLEDDFRTFASLLEEAGTGSFMFRDFQSRNIMIQNQECYFIDYQGGRRGAFQYDPASLLFEARTNLPFSLREELLEYYLDELDRYKNPGRKAFMTYYYPFVLIRMLQTMGTYGLRGWVEKKPLFLQSVPFAVNNLRWLLDNHLVPDIVPELKKVLYDLSASEKVQVKIPVQTDKLRISIVSFSYMKTIPDDLSGNGGGYVFDCRGINNPGRFEQYRSLTGRDEAVQKFLREKSEMADFLSDVFSIIDRTVSTYIIRNHHHLQVSFGCTGGRHRSVYAAEKLAEHLKQNENVVVDLEHREMNQNF